MQAFPLLSLISIMKKILLSLFVLTAGFLFFSDSANAATEMKAKGTQDSDYVSATTAEPEDTISLQMFHNGDSVSTFILTLPDDLTYIRTDTASPNPATLSSIDANTYRWTFAPSTFQIIQLTATVASGGSLSTDHTLEASFTTSGAHVSNIASITTGPIVTALTPSSATNASAELITITGHGFLGDGGDSVTAVELSDGTSLDISNITITDTSISGPSLKILATQAVGSYYVLVTVTSGTEELTTNADSEESVQYTVTDGIPPQMSTGTNSYGHTSRILTLNFDEIIDVSLTDASKITLVDDLTAGNTITLDNAQISEDDSTQVLFTLSQDDINTVSSWGQLEPTLYIHIAGDGIYDTSSNPLSNQPSRTALDSWIKDVTVSNAVITYTQLGAERTSVQTGDVIITVAFDEPIATTPQIAIDQQGTDDLVATNLIGSGDTWTYTYTVVMDDSSAYVDGDATITISNASDYAGNVLGPTSNTTLIIDTNAPSPAITDLSAAGATSSVNLNFTSSYLGIDFSEFRIYYSESTGVDSSNGTLVLTTSSPVQIGSLQAGTNYYFALYICDTAGNCSDKSNEAVARTENNAIVYHPISSGGGSSAPAPTTYQTYDPNTDELMIDGDEQDSTEEPDVDEEEGKILGSSVGAYPNGTLFKAPDSSAVWHIVGDEKHLILSGAIFKTRFNWNDIIELPSSLQIDLYAQGNDARFSVGTLVKEIGNSAVYRVSFSEGLQPILSGDLFLARGYEFENVIEVEQGFLSDYHFEPYITDEGRIYSGDIVRHVDTEDLYLIENNQARLIPSQDIFEENAFNLENARMVSKDRFVKFASGSDVFYPDGTLVAVDDSAIYVVSDGRKRLLASSADFDALLYDWDNVKYISETLLAQIRSGPGIHLIQDVVIAAE